MKAQSQILARIAALQSAPLNSWIALSGDETRVIAHGSSFEEVSAQLETIGDDDAVMMRTPAVWEPLSI